MDCIFCSKTVHEQTDMLDDLLDDMLTILALQKYYTKEVPYKICKECLEAIENSFSFKGQCLITEDLIFPYIKSKKKKLNLRQIYTTESGEIVNDSESFLCRLCLNVRSKCHAICLPSSLRNYNLELMFQEYLSEVNIKITQKPEVCHQCFEDLKSFAEFINMCQNKYLKNTVENSAAVLLKKTRKSVSNSSINKSTKIKRKQILSEQLKCQHCNYTAKNESLLKQHVNELHVKIIKCDKCEYKTRSEKQFKVHRIEKHNSSEVYACRECDFTSKNESSWRKHCKLHTDEPFVCAICKQACSRKDQLKIHIKLKHGSVKKLQCNICSFRTIYIKSLKIHLRTHTDQKPFACSECDYKTGRKDSLKRHAIKHKNNVDRYKCADCSYETKYKGVLTIHFLSHNQVGRATVCPLCDVEFKYRRDHLAHMKEVHDSKGIYKCKLCSLEYINKDSLKIHVKKIHELPKLSLSSSVTNVSTQQQL